MENKNSEVTHEWWPFTNPEVTGMGVSSIKIIIKSEDVRKVNHPLIQARLARLFSEELERMYNEVPGCFGPPPTET